MIPIKHRPKLHPQIKKHFNFSNDRFSWYWIYITYKGGVCHIFNTYDWDIVKKTKHYIVWKNIYKNELIIKVKLKQVHKVVCWKTQKYNLFQSEVIERWIKD